MTTKMSATFEDGVTHEMEPGQLGIIKVALIQLKNYRDDGRAPTLELLDDIRAYESIIGGPNAEMRAETYFEIKKDEPRLRPRQIARMAGWL